MLNLLNIILLLSFSLGAWALPRISSIKNSLPYPPFPTCGAYNPAPEWCWDNKIVGYAGKPSINKGDTVNLYVKTTKPYFNIEVYRMGWNNGGPAFSNSNKVLSVQGISSHTQTLPNPDQSTHLVELNWTTSYTLQTNANWTSGVYIVKLTDASGEWSYILLVIRDDQSPADILFQLPVTTYQAYNNWGGYSLYSFNSNNQIQGRRVSFDRPYSGDGSGGFFVSDFNMIRWLESKGYNVSYTTSVDVHQNPFFMSNKKIFLSNWHDEYWSKEMRDNLTSAADLGKHLAFFDANNMYWQIRLDPSNNGTPNRVITGYKEFVSEDPILQGPNPAPWLATSTWRDPLYANKPENEVLGIMFGDLSLFQMGESYPWIVSDSSHWIYNGTGLKNGDHIPGLIGYEYDMLTNNGLTPQGIRILSESPVKNLNNESQVAHSSIYRRPSGAYVFSAGTFHFAWLLDEYEDANISAHRSVFLPTYQYRVDFRVQKMTENIINTMISGIEPPPTPNLQQPTYYSVYDEKLASGWLDGSWDSTVNHTDQHAYSYYKNISWTANAAFAGLNFIHSTSIDTTGYENFTFSIKGTPPLNHNVGIQFFDPNGNPLTASPLSIASYGTLSSYEYTVFSIPLTSLSAQNRSIRSIHFRNWTLSSQSALYIDKVGFTSFKPIYDDFLDNIWSDWSWDSTNSFADFTSPYSGSYSISWIPNAGFAGLNLHSEKPINILGYQFLTFAMRATQPGASIGVIAFDSNGNPNTTPLLLSNFGGNPVTTGYKIYRIPLYLPPPYGLGADLSRPSIQTIHFRNWSTTPHAKILIDHVGFGGLK